MCGLGVTAPECDTFCRLLHQYQRALTKG